LGTKLLGSNSTASNFLGKEMIGNGMSSVKEGFSKIASSIFPTGGATKSAGGLAKAGNIASIVGTAADMVGSFLPEKTEYNGPKGGITQSMDSVYDSISDELAAIPGWGTLASGIMKGGKLLGKGVNALGGGTDGMTSTDAILGSSFLNLTPVGLINGFGGKKADTITKNNEAFAQVGSSYGGTSAKVDDALTKSGKKYGAFSSHARKKAN